MRHKYTTLLKYITNSIFIILRPKHVPTTLLFISCHFITKWSFKKITFLKWWPWTSRHWLDGWKSCWELELALVVLSSVPPLRFVLLNRPNQGFFPWPDTPYASNSSIIRYHRPTNLEIPMATVCPQTLKQSISKNIYKKNYRISNA